MAARYDLCVITWEDRPSGRGHADVARAALAGGAGMVQLRDKSMSSRELLEAAGEIRSLTRAAGAAFIVNDRVDIALAAEADGVHLGQDDLPIPVARRLLGERAVVGASVDTPDDARAAEAAGASYLGVGPVYPTGSKSDAGEAIGPVALAQIARSVSIPVLAIGGITCENVAETIAAGAAGVAVISAVAGATDMTAAARALCECVAQAQRGRKRSG